MRLTKPQSGNESGAPDEPATTRQTTLDLEEARAETVALSG